MSSPPLSPWIIRRQANPAARFRLFCFPYAGAGAAVFRAWPEELPAEIEVCAIQLPGRESRRREPPFTRLEPLVQQLAQGLLPHLDRPYALFGYSLGALIAFELARQLRRQNAPQPAHLIAAARAAPQVAEIGSAIHTLPEDQLVAEVCRRYDGIPPVILQEVELLRMFLPLLRADLAVMETYVHASEPPLPLPITAFGGTEDITVSRAGLEAWREHAGGGFTMEQIAGNHFFLNTARPQLLERVSQAFRAHLA